MAKEVVAQRGISIRLACQVFTVSESCYRYEAKLNDENTRIADWLLRLTDNNRSWGFGLYTCICAMSEASNGTTSVSTGSTGSWS